MNINKDSNYSENVIKHIINDCIQVVRLHDWLLDFYVVDFYSENHWSKLPKSWQDSLQDMEPQDLGRILLGHKTHHLLPLTLLSLFKVVKSLSIKRIPIKLFVPSMLTGGQSQVQPDTRGLRTPDNTHNESLRSVSDQQKTDQKGSDPNNGDTIMCDNIKTEHKLQKNNIETDKTSGSEHCQDNSYNNLTTNDSIELNFITHPKLKNLFTKHVKLKKRYEIVKMADVVAVTAERSNCQAVIDFGSGLGHLVRILSYKYGIKTVGIECQEQLTDDARKLDKELLYTAKKYLSEQFLNSLPNPHHLNMVLSTPEQLDNIKSPLSDSNYGLIGLHPCGDLGPLLIKHFVQCSKAAFICVVGCCFNKLSCCEGGGYPMSSYLKGLRWKLSYQSREIACHAIEVYSQRLFDGKYEDLKIHAFRGVLEKLLVEIDPKLRHSPVRSIKHSDTMSFRQYCTLATERLGVTIEWSDTTNDRAVADLTLWKHVVVMYTLRLAMAPLVETLILMDRMLFILEHGLACEIHPVFDPTISPRNHIIIGRRL